MRIVAGKFRGRKIEGVPGRTTRPLMGRVREALFNILGDRAEGALVWDLFAGTGASGLEAMSRGARGVAFVERGRLPLEVLKRNLSILKQDIALEEEAFQVFRANAWAPPLPSEEGFFADPPGLIFLDPPYPQVKKAPGKALAHLKTLLGKMGPEGILIFHFPRGVFDLSSFQGIGKADLRSWGEACVCLLSPFAFR